MIKRLKSKHDQLSAFYDIAADIEEISETQKQLLFLYLAITTTAKLVELRVVLETQSYWNGLLDLITSLYGASKKPSHEADVQALQKFIPRRKDHRFISPCSQAIPRCAF
ncbi:hypothetical protein K438DRAFT_1802708 [Mycena galopus ATCC 62051]|nr:hypothetical protein K438DRAFT_1802708 [Mycena galopus ATCC 62051]